MFTHGFLKIMFDRPISAEFKQIPDKLVSGVVYPKCRNCCSKCTENVKQANDTVYFGGLFLHSDPKTRVFLLFTLCVLSKFEVKNETHPHSIQRRL